MYFVRDNVLFNVSQIRSFSANFLQFIYLWDYVWLKRIPDMLNVNVYHIIVIKAYFPFGERFI